MLTQLNPPLPMETSKGLGLALFVIDYGIESHLFWVVFMDADGACWTIPNPEVRLQMNWSLPRRSATRKPEKPVPTHAPAPNVVGIKPNGTGNGAEQN
jgi:hypothetical protein